MNDPATVFEQAVACFRQGRLEEAKKLSARMLKERPGNFDALHLLGIIKLQSGNPGAAVGFLESALKANPDSPDALSHLAMALVALGRDNEALALLNRAQALDPNSWHTLNLRGTLLARLNRAEEGLADFDRAIAIEPRNPGIALNRGNALAQLKRFTEAVAQYDAVLSAQPNLAEVQNNRGNLYLPNFFERRLAGTPIVGLCTEWKSTRKGNGLFVTRNGIRAPAHLEGRRLATHQGRHAIHQYLLRKAYGVDASTLKWAASPQECVAARPMRWCCSIISFITASRRAILPASTPTATPGRR